MDNKNKFSLFAPLDPVSPVEMVKIAVVEDELVIASHIQDILQKLGYVASLIPIQEEVADAILEYQPDLILMDIYLGPNMDGVEVAKQIYSQVDTPIVFLTAHSDSSTLERAKVVSPAGFIVKPFQDQTLYTTIEMALNKYKQDLKIREYEARLHSITDNIQDVVIQVTPEGLIEYVSPSVDWTFGYSVENMIGTSIFIYINTPHVDLFRQALDKLVNDGSGVLNIQYQAYHADGRLMEIESVGKLIKRKGGKISGIVLGSRDITERKRAMDEAQRLNENLEEKVAERTELLENLNQRLSEEIIERIKAQAQDKKQLRKLASLRKIEKMIISSSDLMLTSEIVFEEVIAQLEADAVDVLYLGSNQMLSYFNASGLVTSGIEKRYQEYFERVERDFTGEAILNQKTLYLPNLAELSPSARLNLLVGDGFNSYIGIPLISKGQVKGIMEIFFRRYFYPEAEWLSLFEAFAGQMAIALENWILFDGLQRSVFDLSVAYDATILGWSRAMDLRDKETEGHTQRVTKITLQIARMMGFKEEDISYMRWGALLHDIGKMGIPDAILSKPGPLTDEEWVIMRKHPDYAFQFLSPIEFLRLSLDIPYTHHEKWDGSGYPRGLVGNQIPLSGRIFAMADVWDALVSDRVYRKAWSQDRAVEYICQQAGKHFDPELIPAFLAVVQSESSPLLENVDFNHVLVDR